MSIAVVTPVFPPYKGGIGTVAFHHARVLAEAGEQVTVFTPDYGHKRTKESYPFSLELVKPLVKHGNAGYVPSLARKLKNFDTVLLQYPFFGGAGVVYRAQKKYGFKLLVSYNMDVVGSGLKGLIFSYNTKYFLPRLIKHADVVIASSDDYARHSDLKNYWDDTEKFQVVPIGVDVKKFAPQPSDDTFKKNLNLTDEKVILFVGGLDPAHYFKGVEYLVRAIPHITTDVPFKVVVVGRGSLQAEYRALAEKISVKDKVIFTGGVSDEALVKCYQMGYVTVLPSVDQSESFGIVLVESMACGTPVITSDLPGVRSVYEKDVSGFAVPPKDERALAKKIQYMLNHSDVQEVMGKAGRSLVEKKYDWNVIQKHLVSLI